MRKLECDLSAVFVDDVRCDTPEIDEGGETDHAPVGVEQFKIDSSRQGRQSRIENKQVELIGKPVVTVQNQIGDDKGEKDYNAIHQEDAPIWKSLFREIPIANFFE